MRRMTRPCSVCAEEIQEAAIKCRFCGERFTTEPAQPQSAPTRVLADTWVAAPRPANPSPSAAALAKVVAYPTSSPVYPSRRVATNWANPASTWNRVVAVVGVVFAFFFLLTLPGWFAAKSYGRWKRYEGDGRGLLIWGYITIAFWVVVGISALGHSAPS